MGEVYKARHRSLGRIVALKVLKKERLAKPDSIRRFRREMQAAARLSHPNIVMAYDADGVGDQTFFAMEYVDGIDLSKLVKKRGPLPLPQAANYIRQAALGLQHAHEQGMVHRDIKPSNLLLSRDGTTVKILDVGLARIGDPDDDAFSALTRTGRVVGTRTTSPLSRCATRTEPIFAAISTASAARFTISSRERSRSRTAGARSCRS